MLFHLQVSLVLYVILKWTSWEWERPWRMLPPGGPEKLDWLGCGQANLHLRQSPQWQTPRFPHGWLKTFGSTIYSHYDWVGCTGRVHWKSNVRKVTRPDSILGWIRWHHYVPTNVVRRHDHHVVLETWTLRMQCGSVFPAIHSRLFTNGQSVLSIWVAIYKAHFHKVAYLIWLVGLNLMLNRSAWQSESKGTAALECTKG